MPIFVYILLGIALLIAFVLLSKVRFFICYEDSLRVYAKFWFFKFSILPEKEKKPKKSKKKEPSTSVIKQTDEKKEPSIPRKLWEMRKALCEITNKFLSKVHFRFLKLKINVSCENAAKTALLYSAANQGVVYIIEILRNISNVDVTRKSDVSVNADFISLKSDLEGKIELYIRVVPFLSVWMQSMDTIFNSTKED